MIFGRGVGGVGLYDGHVSDLKRKLAVCTAANADKASFYDGREKLEDLGISLPPALTSLPVVVGWPSAAVDVLEERLDFEGWSDPALDDVYRENDLDVLSSMVHIDALIYGTAFVVVSGGGDSQVEIDAVSPFEMVADRDPRTGRITRAAQFITDDNKRLRCVLYLPDRTVWLGANNGVWRVEDEVVHNMGTTQVVQFVNRPRASKMGGRSEITPMIRYCTQAGLRTLAGAEVAREFYAVPQRWMMGAPESFFLDDDGNPRGAWDAMAGKILAMEADPDTGDKPQVGQFTAYGMAPFFEQLRTYAQLVSAEASIPPSYLGFVSDNPASADAIRATENRLVKKAERRQSAFGKSWTEVARLVVKGNPGIESSLRSGVGSIRPMWRDAATPTLAATTDAVIKEISAGVAPARGEYIQKRLGLNMFEREMLARDWAKASSQSLVEQLRNSQADGSAEVAATLANKRS